MGILTGLLPRPSVGLWVCLSFGRSVWKVYCGKTVDWIRMPFGVVSGVGRGMGVLDVGGDRGRRRGSFGVNVGYPIVTKVILCVRGGDVAFPKSLWDFLLMIDHYYEHSSAVRTMFSKTTY